MPIANPKLECILSIDCGVVVLVRPSNFPVTIAMGHSHFITYLINSILPKLSNSQTLRHTSLPIAPAVLDGETAECLWKAMLAKHPVPLLSTLDL